MPSPKKYKEMKGPESYSISCLLVAALQCHSLHFTTEPPKNPAVGDVKFYYFNVDMQ